MSFLAKMPVLPLRKISFLAILQILIEKYSIESVGSKTSSGTHFGSPKGPGTKKMPKEDKLGFGPKLQFLIKNNTQTAVINIINLRIIYKLDVSYASQHTFSKVTVTNF